MNKFDCILVGVSLFFLGVSVLMLRCIRWLQKVMDIGRQTSASRYFEIQRLNADLDAALNAMRGLRDFQNGCPLPKYEVHWQRYYDLCGEILQKHGK